MKLLTSGLKVIKSVKALALHEISAARVPLQNWFGDQTQYTRLLCAKSSQNSHNEKL